MMLYLTGAPSSLANSSEAPQSDVAKSLGGYISSSVVPNGSVNALFDMISLLTLKNKNRETIAIGLINKFDESVRNVQLKLVTRKDYIGKFRVAATDVGSDYMMEHIDNIYSEPIQAVFNDVDFYRASVDVEIVNPGVEGEVISIQPLDINITIEESGMDGTMKSILGTLANDYRYGARKLSNNKFELFSKYDDVVSDPIECIAVCSENAELKFDGDYYNGKNNIAFISEELKPGQAIGLWLQRYIVPKTYTDEELVKMSDDGVEFEKEEDVELVITYDLSQ